MDDEELIKKFIRVGRWDSFLEHDDFLKAPVFVPFDVVAICVCEIEWPTPGRSESHWTVVSKLPLDASEAQIDTAVRSILPLSTLVFSACVRRAVNARPME